jgi:hypothetical protein
MLVPFGTHVLDRDRKSVGTVSRLVLHPESRQMVAIGTETTIPAGVIASVADDRITLGVSADELKKLEPGPIGQLGRARAS